MFKIRTKGLISILLLILVGVTYDRTFENSVEGDMTKLSLVLDHDIKCWMLGSSNILHRR